jgi:hypothetical protein
MDIRIGFSLGDITGGLFGAGRHGLFLEFDDEGSDFGVDFPKFVFDVVIILEGFTEGFHEYTPNVVCLIEGSQFLEEESPESEPVEVLGCSLVDEPVIIRTRVTGNGGAIGDMNGDGEVRNVVGARGKVGFLEGSVDFLEGGVECGVSDCVHYYAPGQVLLPKQSLVSLVIRAIPLVNNVLGCSSLIHDQVLATLISDFFERVVESGLLMLGFIGVGVIEWENPKTRKHERHKTSERQSHDNTHKGTFWW